MATRKFVVTGEQNDAFYSRRFELERQWRLGVLDPDVVLPALQVLNEPASGKKVIVVQSLPLKNDWLTAILNAERQCHRDFFGREFDLAEFEKTLRKYGRKQIKDWQRLGLEPHFLPKVSMMFGDDYPGWKIKPEKWFYEKQLEGKLFLNINSQLVKMIAVELGGKTVLIDTRLKPAYDNGRQMYENDSVLGSIIERLRKEKKIARYDHGSQSSRFGVSADGEWENEIKLFWAREIDLETSQICLEQAIEANVIPQLYPHMPRKDDGKTNTWVWYEEYSEGRDYRLGGGYSGSGGFAHVSYDDAGSHWDDRSFRPLAVL